MRYALRLSHVIGILLATGLGWASFSNALGNVKARSNPQLAAAQLGARSGTLLAAHDPALLAKAPPEARHAAFEAARRALSVQIVNPDALATMGMVADLEGRHAEAERLFGDSHILSRRQLVTETWLLERNVARNSVSGVLEQYDIILRQSPGFQTVAFPIIDAALVDPEIEAAFKPYVTRATPWMAEFIGFSAATSPAPQILAGMLLRTGKVREAMQLKLELPTFFQRLIEARHAELIRPFYLAGGGPAAVLSSVKLDGGAIDPAIAPVAWRFGTGSDLAAQAMLDPNNRAVINVKATTVERKVAADKLLFLPPGSYQLTYGATAVSPQTTGSGEWIAACLGSGGATVRGRTGNLLGKSSVSGVMRFDVGVECSAMQLVLEVSGGGDEGEFEVNFGNLQLGPVGLRR